MTLDLSNSAHVEALRVVCCILPHERAYLAGPLSTCSDKTERLAARTITDPCAAAELLRRLLERCGVRALIVRGGPQEQPGDRGAVAWVVDGGGSAPELGVCWIDELPARILAILAILAIRPVPICDQCGVNRATCYGAYEDDVHGYACDRCCAHGCEDGNCSPLAVEPRNAALAALRGER